MEFKISDSASFALKRLKAAGYEAYILFVIQMKEICLFRPNDKMHPEFGEALRNAKSSGVKIIAMDCIVTPDSMEIDIPVETDI